VLHLGARTDLRGKRVEDYPANTAGVVNLIAACARAEALDRVVFASSRMVCRIGYSPRHEEDYCPPNAYGASKVEGERLVRASDLHVPWVIVRPTSIWGPWFDVPYKDFFTAIRRGRYRHVRGHDPRKSFGFVGNSVHQLEALLSAPADAIAGTTMYLADYPPLVLSEWAREIQGALGAPAIRTVPEAPLRVAAAIGDLARAAGWKEPPLTRFRLANLLTEMVHDTGPLERIAGPLPHDMRNGVRSTVAWMRAHGEA
jgi:nucleoside-diphosphate-sugar epimerase